MKTVKCDGCGKEMSTGDINHAWIRDVSIDNFMFSIKLGKVIHMKYKDKDGDDRVKPADMCDECEEKYRTRLLGTEITIEEY